MFTGEDEKIQRSCGLRKGEVDKWIAVEPSDRWTLAGGTFRRANGIARRQSSSA